MTETCGEQHQSEDWSDLPRHRSTYNTSITAANQLRLVGHKYYTELLRRVWDYLESVAGKITTIWLSLSSLEMFTKNEETGTILL